jgi:hypothetical protein
MANLVPTTDTGMVENIMARKTERNWKPVSIVNSGFGDQLAICLCLLLHLFATNVVNTVKQGLGQWNEYEPVSKVPNKFKSTK